MKIADYGSPCFTGPVGIGIDPSLTAFGIAAVDRDGNYLARVIKPGDVRGPERLVLLQQAVTDFVFWAPFNELIDVAIEGTVRNSPAASVLGELTGAVKAHIYREWRSSEGEGMLPLNVPAMTLKVYVNGPGKGTSKSQILLSIYKKWGVDIGDDNAADAYGLARIAAGLANTEYEKTALARLKDGKFRL